MINKTIYGKDFVLNLSTQMIDLVHIKGSRGKYLNRRWRLDNFHTYARRAKVSMGLRDILPQRLDRLIEGMSFKEVENLIQAKIEVKTGELLDSQEYSLFGDPHDREIINLYSQGWTDYVPKSYIRPQGFKPISERTSADIAVWSGWDYGHIKFLDPDKEGVQYSIYSVRSFASARKMWRAMNHLIKTNKLKDFEDGIELYLYLRSKKISFNKKQRASNRPYLK